MIRRCSNSGESKSIACTYTTHIVSPKHPPIFPYRDESKGGRLRRTVQAYHNKACLSTPTKRKPLRRKVWRRCFGEVYIDTNTTLLAAPFGVGQK